MPFFPGENALRNLHAPDSEPMNALAHLAQLMPREIAREEIIAAMNARRKRPEVYLGSALDELSRMSQVLEPISGPAAPMPQWDPRPLMSRIPDKRFSPNVEDRRW
jgi:hypothetical protein